jgi:ATP-dependent DNA helicase HFM1/MER3
MSMATGPTFILYVSPLRSICQEKVREWQCRFEQCGLSVLEYTGDTVNAFPFSIRGHTLLCATPEKCDLATRGWNKRVQMFTQISLMIVDEVHMLGDPRGAVLEAMISRILFISDQNPGRPIRIIALSATCPNYQDVAQWLRVPFENARKTVFGEEYRPTKLSTYVFGYTTSQNDWIFESSLTQRLSSIIKKYSEDKPVLIFCCTRKSCEKTASRLVSDFPSSQNADLDTTAIKDKGLALCLKGGVGFHTAGLCQTDRTLVEQLYLRGAIRILCTTSTLAQGINLPANVVIVKGTKHYTDNSLQEYDSTQILQMAGRAGRPQFHDHGTCVIMTEAKNVKKYEDIVSNSKAIESSLMDNLAEHLNAEIALEFISNTDDVIRWLRSTYLYIRVQKNPLYYHLSDSRFVQKFLQDLCMKHLNELKSQQLISLESNGNLASLPAGSICSQYGVMIRTMVTFLEADPPSGLRSTLTLLSLATEFQENVVRQEEKQKLRMMSVDPMLRYGDRSSDDANFYAPETKVYILIESALAHGHIDDWSLAQEFSRIKRTAERLLACIFDLMVQKKSFSGATNAILLQKCIAQQMWDNEKVRISQQIKGIGEVYAKKIHAAGCETCKDLRGLQPYQIERMTNHRIGWGIPILEEVSRVPNYAVTVSSDDIPDEVCIVVRNMSQQDPTSAFHKADVLVGIEESDQLINHFRIKNVVGHLHTTFHVQIPDGFTLHDVTVRVIDAEFVGIDTDSKAPSPEKPVARAKTQLTIQSTPKPPVQRSFLSSPESPPKPASPKLASGGVPRTRVPAMPPSFLSDDDSDEEEEVVVWEMKKPARSDDFLLDPDFWNQLEFDESDKDDP